MAVLGATAKMAGTANLVPNNILKKKNFSEFYPLTLPIMYV
jgi:hypothetical protein